MPWPIWAVRSRRSAPPRPRRSTTSPQADQVTQLVSASEADPDLGFMARMLALCSLPRTNPGNRHQYKRANGPYKLVMVAGADNKLPYGNLPRLLLAWLCTEAVRTQSRELVLGRSLSEFMRTLDIYSTSGGTSGGRTRLRNQMKRLFGCSVSLIYEDERGQATVSSLIARRTEFWWNERKPDEPSLWESKIELSEDFFNEIISHPVPLDMNTLTRSNAAPWASISTSGSPTASLRFVLRYGSPGGSCTSSSTQPPSEGPISKPSKSFVARFSRVNQDQGRLARPELRHGSGLLILHPSTPAIAPVAAPLRLAQ